MIKTFNKFINEAKEEREFTLKDFLNSDEYVYHIGPGKGSAYNTKKYFEDNDLDYVYHVGMITLVKFVTLLNDNKDKIIFLDDIRLDDIDIRHIIKNLHRGYNNIQFSTNKTEVDFKFTGKLIIP